MNENFKHKFDISKPRRLYHSKVVGLSACPECGLTLIEDACSIMIIAKADRDEAEFMSNLSGSHFCNSCPVVVVDSDKVEKAVLLGMQDHKNLKYHIEGIIDFNAIPKEKKHLEIGSEENPVPIVPFLPDLNKPTIVAVKKTSRNALCTCGSGKKYKRCCGK